MILKKYSFAYESFRAVRVKRDLCSWTVPRRGTFFYNPRLRRCAPCLGLWRVSLSEAVSCYQPEKRRTKKRCTDFTRTGRKDLFSYLCIRESMIGWLQYQFENRKNQILFVSELIMSKVHNIVDHKFVNLGDYYYLCKKEQGLWRNHLFMACRWKARISRIG